jgi:hypothetical protein
VSTLGCNLSTGERKTKKEEKLLISPEVKEFPLHSLVTNDYRDLVASTVLDKH